MSNRVAAWSLLMIWEEEWQIDERRCTNHEFGDDADATEGIIANCDLIIDISNPFYKL
jgi:hypothetical protein